MKKLIYTLAFVVMGITASYAQKREKQTPEQRAEREATAMQQKLSLTADQKAKVQAIQLERITKMEALRTGEETDVKAKIEQRKSFAKANNEKIEAILTPEQKKTWETARAEMKDKMRSRADGKAPRAPRAPKSPKTEKATPAPAVENN